MQSSELFRALATGVVVGLLVHFIIRYMTAKGWIK